MSESANLLELVQAQLDQFCEQQRTEFEAISPDLLPLVDYSKDLMSGGKRFRALFTYWSWVGALSVAEPQQSSEQLQASSEAMIGITAALEMFHAAALVHDDLLDQSDTRRGAPSVHKRFESLHSHSGWAGSPQRFGMAGSVLVGDLLLSWSSEIFGRALQGAPSREIELACRDEFSKMRTEVMAGQYLDVLEENAALTRPLEEAVGRANRVMLYKTAKYSIEAPMLIGAAFAGADSGLLRGLSAFAIPLGMAFQMRDDILGVFGDPAVTGKPAGDDLREGKRTVLVGLTRETLKPSVAAVFDEMLTSRELNEEQIKFLQQTIIGCGALAKAERMIDELADQCFEALSLLDISEPARDQLRGLAQKVIKRDA
ncbi:MAG: polyprenyl synthetase family protein [Micrococcales bacterium]